MAEVKPIVLVTGITGFVGSHVANQLLSAGYRVRGTLRSLKKKDEVFNKIVPSGASNLLELREIDLLDSAEKWEEVVRGCEYIQHIASPFPLKKPKHEDDLIKPAVEGTQAVLRAALKVGGVKRVVLTSSIAAMVSGRQSEYDTVASDGTVLKKGHIFDESDWTDIAKADAYSKSKTLAEKSAWEFVKTNGNPFELAVINPGFISGPYLLPYFASSAEVVKAIMTNEYPVVPDPFYLVYCDVRDVALAHIRAMEIKEAAGNRLELNLKYIFLKF
ncbi:hypothetical protein HK096_008551 [Nowakowskiella sp. JEL0078]|nr:hypothetical protein HK096_008551 [Nowakowskiella sp. JEL0078]